MQSVLQTTMTSITEDKLSEEKVPNKVLAIITVQDENAMNFKMTDLLMLNKYSYFINCEGVSSS